MTHCLTDIEAVARAEAGRAAMQLCHEHGADTASKILIGRTHAYIVATAQVCGWPETVRIFTDIYAREHPDYEAGRRAVEQAGGVTAFRATVLAPLPADSPRNLGTQARTCPG